MKIELNKNEFRSAQLLIKGIDGAEDKVKSRAINNTLRSMVPQSAKLIGTELNLPAKRIKKDITVKKATKSVASGMLIFKSRPIGLAQFGARQTKKGVSVKVKKTGKRSLIKHAFMSESNQKGQSGIKHVFRREYRGAGARYNPTRNYAVMPRRFRYDIERLSGPRIADYADGPPIGKKITDKAAEVYQANYSKSLDDELRRLNGLY